MEPIGPSLPVQLLEDKSGYFVKHFFFFLIRKITLLEADSALCRSQGVHKPGFILCH